MRTRRETSVGAAHRGARGRLRTAWLVAIAVVGLLGAWLLFAGSSGPPPPRPSGAGLPPALSRPIIPPPVEGPADSLRAEISQEEARLAALRAARARLEREVAALQQQADERRQAPGASRASETGATVPPLPATRGTPPVPAAPAPQAAASPTEAATRGVRVFVHHRAGSSPGASAAEDVVETLRGTGIDIAAVRTAPFVPSTPVVRYFHEEDQAAAARLAVRLGRGWAIQDFRAYQPQPPPRTLEVWLPGG